MPDEKKAFDWSNVLVAGLGAVGAVAGSAAGPYVALALLLVIVGAGFFIKYLIKKAAYEALQKKTDEKAGGEASDQNKKIDDNRKKVDDFAGRKPR